MANLVSRRKKPQPRSKQEDAVSLKSQEAKALADYQPKRQQRCFSAHHSNPASDNSLSADPQVAGAAPTSNCDKNGRLCDDGGGGECREQ